MYDSGTHAPETITLSEVTIYPIKSTAGISLSSAWLDEFGLAFDRRFVLTMPNGEFVTARTQSKLCLVQANIVPQGLMLTAPNMPSLFVDYNTFIHENSPTKRYQRVDVWDDSISSLHCQASYDKWFSDFLGKPCQLMYFGKESTRQVKETTQQTAFADAYPLLLISQASLDYLNSKLEQPVSMKQFRPNLVVQGCAPFEEDTWQRIRIGDAEFELSSPCSRCVFTTVDPKTGYKHNEMEPLQTLKSFRQVLNGDIMLGQNLRQLNLRQSDTKGSQGVQLKLGDEITVLERKAPPRFMATPSQEVNAPTSETALANTNNRAIEEVNPATLNIAQASSKPTEKKSGVKLNFSSWNKAITGNTKHSILEQAEDAGIMLPYSCRGGMCGRCKVTLEQGEVKQLATDGLSEREQRANAILTCSSIPLTDIVISKP